ncbi:MAG: hypothetical protein C5B56_05145 [Proteobacteria bacterium]|nr:MAG: hypothetical protein C5B56_05145 [Pseudomonadota bacterium]
MAVEVQKVKKLLAAIAGSLFLNPFLCSRASPTPTATNDYAGPVLPLTPQSSVPCEIYDGYLIVVPGRIGPLEGLHFALDTGATNTMIDKHIASALRLPRYPARALSLGKPTKTELANLPELQLGPLHGAHLPVVVADLGFFRSFATRIDAVIGVDLLRRQNFTLDFVAHQVTFGAARPGRHEISLQLASDVSLFGVELTAQDHTLHVVVDSGASAVILYRDCLQRRALVYAHATHARGLGVAGFELGTTATLAQMNLAGAPINPRIYIAPDPDRAPPIEPRKSPERVRDGYLALAALNATFISFDFSSQKMFWSN